MTYEQVPEELDSLGHASGVEAEEVTEAPTDGDQFHEPFDPDQIDVITRTLTVDLLLSRIRSHRIDLQPDFQRRAGIWNARTKSRLIESLLLRIPLPTLYAAEADDDSWAMVDGIQRLTTIAEFIEPTAIGTQPMRLHDLEYLSTCKGKTFDELSGRLQTRLRETELVVHLVRRGTPEEVKFNIFARINTGGLPLSRQELRHALIPGRARELLKELADSKTFHNATTGSIKSDRMADREMVLRFFAFRLNDPFHYAERDFDKFLRRAMREINSLPGVRMEDLKKEFGHAMVWAQMIFGEHAFRKQCRGATKRYPISKSLFEAVAVNLAGLVEGQFSKLVDRRDRVRDEFLDLMENVEFEQAISLSTGAPSRVRYRFAAIHDLLAKVLDDPGTGAA